MSYILDALRKSDQQRQRGAAPINLATAATPPERRPPAYRNGLLALLLVVAGVIIGWLRPWQETQPAPEVIAQPATRPSLPVPAQPPVQAAPPAPRMAEPPATPARIEPPAPPPRTTPPPPAPVPVAAEASGAEHQPKVMSLSELPQAVRQGIPAIAISLHGYASNPGERFVMINNQLLRQGDLVAPGIRLEQITTDGVLLGYQGYRFHRGVR
ncbi:MAG: general secretion pathway protein GspB [Pseudomonadota bacterium]|nr:general secretion pathway protein GspB [Pseudomonadota bacterium]MDP1902751.1 general secretion pathway protein GspB [Pseudomonadota bacterium]MDP2350985.1 general secretion pathway protein GspB [Pseudomonadota bacterium]